MSITLLYFGVLKDTLGCSTETLAWDGGTTATLLVSGSAPPMPSIWRGSGEPMMRSRRRSRSWLSAGRSSARK